MGGTEKRIPFGTRQPPLGLDFSTQLPIVVKRVRPNGHAADLGVREDWLLKSINGVPVHGLEPKVVFSKLSSVVLGDGLNSNPPATPARNSGQGLATQAIQVSQSYSGGDGMVLGFRLPDNSVRRINFADKRPPLGMEFERALPVCVKQVTRESHADRL